MTQKKQKDGQTCAEGDEKPDPIMSELKEMYDSIVEEPLPQELLVLLDKLDEAERSR